MNPVTYYLSHDRYDGQQDHEKLLGVYSQREKAEEALALLQSKPGFREHSDGFEICQGPMDGVGWLEGFASVWGDEEPDPNYIAKPPERVVLPSAQPMPQNYWVLWHRYVNEWDVLQQN